jgi:FkbM family methyltransferase
MKQAAVFLGRAWRNLNRRISRLYLNRQLRGAGGGPGGGPAGGAASGPGGFERLGSAQNGWYRPRDLPRGARCYCIGVGLDASFDFALAERGAEVHAFDPTPAAIAYMERVNAGRVAFHPWGVLDSDSTMRLYQPMSADHGSHFLHDLHQTGKFHEVPCYRLATIMGKLGHDRIDLMKMDIEGSWYEALQDMVAAGIRPGILEVEYDSPAPIWRVARIHRLLVRAGYALILREADNAIYRRAA